MGNKAGNSTQARISRIVAHQHEVYGLPPPTSLSSEVSKYFTSFIEHLHRSRNVLALIGAGLSASSGLPTHRDSGRLWTAEEARLLATPGSFAKRPIQTWLFFQNRKRMALRALPNRGHVALAELAKRKPGLLAMTQNIDAFSQRACHVKDSLIPMHGPLFKLRCSNPKCGYVRENACEESFIGILPDTDLSNLKTPVPEVLLDQLPHCPECKTSLLRPDVVLFGEPLPEDALAQIEAWFESRPTIDLVLIVGTSACVTPASDYIERATAKGARVAIFNIDQDEKLLSQLGTQDWVFKGDAASILELWY